MKHVFKKSYSLFFSGFCALAVSLFFACGSIAAAGWEYQSLAENTARYSVVIGDARNDGISRVYSGAATGVSYSATEYKYNWGGSSWTAVDIPPAGGIFFNSDTNGIAIGKGKNDGKNYLYECGDNDNTAPTGRVVQFEWTGSSWSAAVQIGTGTMSMTDVAVGNVMNSSGTDQQVYASNADGHVYMYNWTGSEYERIIVGTTTAVINAIAVGEGWRGGMSSVYAVTADSHVYQFRWETDSFKKLIIDTAPASLNDIAIWDESDNKKIFAAGDDGHVYQYQCTDGHFSWARTDVGQCDGTGPMVKVVVGEGKNDGVRRVYGVASNDGLYEFSYSGSWSKEKIVDVVNTLGIGEGRNVPGLNSIFIMPVGGDVPLTEYCYDAVAPEAITNLSAATGDSLALIDLTWISPGDDGTRGIIWNDSINSNDYYTDIGSFRIDYATHTKSWDSANYQIEIDTLTSPGDVNSYTVNGLLDAVTYYFCIWTSDNVGNWSDASNISTATAGAIEGTYVYTDINEDTFWTESNSPYVLNTDLTVSSGTTLTIDPGVTVKFRGNYSITNNGIIDAQGDSFDHITFEYYISSAQAPGSWNQIYVDGDSGGYVNFDYCDISAAACGIYISSGNVQNKIYNSVISSCTTGINNISWFYSPDILIDGCTFSDCGTGTAANNYVISDSYFVKNTTAVLSTRGTISGSLFENNYSAIYNPDPPFSGYSVTGSSFISNTNYAYFAENDLTYCYFEDNGIGASIAGIGKFIGNSLTGNTTGVIYIHDTIGDPAEFHHNNFNGSVFHDLDLSSNRYVTLSYNWWGTTITAVIDQKIVDDSNWGTYTPVLTEAYVYKKQPRPVTDLAAVTSPSTGGALDLSWTEPADDNGAVITAYSGFYRIKYTTKSLYAWSVSDYDSEVSLSITEGEAYSTSVEDLIWGATYYVRVWAADAEGNWSSLSNGTSSYAKGSFGVTIPAVVDDLSSSSSTLTEEKIRWTWSPASGALTYKVFDSSDNWINKIINYDPSGYYYMDETPLSPNTLYRRYVTAYNNGGFSSSTVVSVYTKADEPTALTALLITAHTIQLSWTAPAVGGAPAYQIKCYDFANRDWEVIAGSGLSLTTTTYTDSGLTENTSYQYRVFSYNSDGVLSRYESYGEYLTLFDTTTPPSPDSDDVTVPQSVAEDGSVVIGGTVTLSGSENIVNIIVTLYDQENRVIGTASSDGSVSSPYFTNDLSVSTSGVISGNVDLSPDLTANFPLAEKVKIGIQFEDDGGNVSALPAASSLSETTLTKTASATPASRIYNNKITNPGTDCAIISYDMPSAGTVSIKIYDLRGRLVKTVFEGTDTSGQKYWYGKNSGGKIVASGIYLVAVEAGGKTDNYKIAVVK